MLVVLGIYNIVLIDRLELSLGPGLGGRLARRGRASPSCSTPSRSRSVSAVTADWCTRVFVNDMAVSVQLLRRLGDVLVEIPCLSRSRACREIHGQDGDRALAGAEAQRDLLDAFGGLGASAGG